ncbi:substrate-binding and VWA domain-containing protein [Actinoplanes sichuanensis]|uniref:Substrate-binding domain-containing protein n=1 Tax=Actinoplanes sichuanensis TaxID=512349 RepID=A0ABW4AAC1_9ACTN|nr:substrate-binding domain-containing protein [Actinoplanes sichuanensis]BEL09053.1 substrate-binding and VWA domain-containing protein [Actinoplanes sichuanensis]
MSDNEWPRQLPPPDHGDWSEAPHSRGRLLLAAVLVITVLLVAGGVAWRLMSNGTSTPAAQSSAAPVPSVSSPTVTPCPDPELTVAAAPEIAPVIEKVAADLKPAGQRCAPIVVRAEEPGVTVDAKDQPDVWVPSSSVWLRIAADRNRNFQTSGATLAWSPIVLAAPPALADQYAQDSKTAWTTLIKAVTEERVPVVTMPDPLLTTTGLLSVHGVHAATALTTKDPGIAQLRALTLRSRLTKANADPTALITQMAREEDAGSAAFGVGVFPVVEQQVAAYQKAGHKVGLTPAVPVDGQVEADYPFAVRKGVKTRLVEQLRAAISKPDLAEAGFRTEPTAGTARLPETAAAMLTPAKQWAGFQTVAFQVLLLIDNSGSMNEKIGAGPETKASLLRQSGISAAELFNEQTTIGMWYFGAAGAADAAHTEVVPFGPITAAVDGKPRRQALGEAIGSYRPQAGAGTPLYQSVLDGVEAMRAQAQPGRPSVVVVLTDGDDGGTRFAMTQQEFLKRLNAGRDPARPVQIFAVGYGPGADLKSLGEMAKATGGQAIGARNPADLASAMAKAFLATRSS